MYWNLLHLKECTEHTTVNISLLIRSCKSWFNNFCCPIKQNCKFIYNHDAV